jgi:hypothetical protein
MTKDDLTKEVATLLSRRGFHVDYHEVSALSTTLVVRKVETRSSRSLVVTQTSDFEITIKEVK